VSLGLGEEQVRDAFRKNAGQEHPDAGGDEESFAGLREAQEILLSPARRLGEWMKCMGMEVEKRGQIDGDLMKLFERVAEAGNVGDCLIRDGEAVKTALAKALWEVKVMKLREVVKELLEEVNEEIANRVGEFGGVERGEVDAGRVMRDLIFLEKWRTGLRALFGKLI